MNTPSKVMALASLSLLGAGVLCPPCRDVLAQLRTTETEAQAAQAATVRLHVSKMTCGSCALTAQVALRRIPGVLDARVTYEDSSAVVRYDAGETNPKEIARQLAEATGYGVRILVDSARTKGSSIRPAYSDRAG